ncbi:hypothetical protein KJ656_10795 [bacterium]|nr:hypothetical protein [bacterium]
MKIISKNLLRNIFWVGVFGIALGFLEAIVVIYLRDMYYPQGFGFPLSPVAPRMYLAELIRELSTIIMLLVLGYLVGKTTIQKLSYFFYSFAVWDIVYYIVLKMFLNWPSSLLTWDVLFLIPMPWLGPVIAPLIVSISMICASGLLLILEDQKNTIKLKSTDWALLLIGAGLIFTSFIWNYSTLIIRGGFFSSFWTLANNQEFLKIVYDYKPDFFNWPVFVIGEVLIFLATGLVFIRHHNVFLPQIKWLHEIIDNVRQHVLKLYSF